MTSTWKPIAWRWNDRAGPWREIQGAPVTIDVARALTGMAPHTQARPGYYMAHHVAGPRTELWFKVTQV